MAAAQAATTIGSLAGEAQRAPRRPPTPTPRQVLSAATEVAAGVATEPRAAPCRGPSRRSSRRGIPDGSNNHHPPRLEAFRTARSSLGGSFTLGGAVTPPRPSPPPFRAALPPRPASVATAQDVHPPLSFPPLLPPPAPLSQAPPPDLSPRRPPAAGRNSRPSARRRTNVRGGLVIDGDRPVPPPKATIAKINVLNDGDLGISENGHKRIRRSICFAIKQILGSTAPFCEHDGDKLRRAVLFMEEREPRLAVYELGWGACALLSRALSDRRQRQPRRRRVVAVADAGASITATDDGTGTNAGDGVAPPAQATEEQQLARQQLDCLNQLE